MWAECLLKLVQTKGPLHGLYNEMHLVLVNHRRLKRVPPQLPPGNHFGDGRGVPAELVRQFLPIEATHTSMEPMETICYSLLFDGAYKKRLCVPPEAFIAHFVTADCELKYHTLAFTYRTIQEYRAYLASKALKKEKKKFCKDAVTLFGAAMQLKRLETKLLAHRYRSLGGGGGGCFSEKVS